MTGKILSGILQKNIKNIYSVLNKQRVIQILMKKLAKKVKAQAKIMDAQDRIDQNAEAKKTLAKKDKAKDKMADAEKRKDDAEKRKDGHGAASFLLYEASTADDGEDAEDARALDGALNPPPIPSS